MGRRVHWLFGLVFCLLGSMAPLARAQDRQPIVPTVTDIPGLPKVDVPPPVGFKNEPKVPAAKLGGPVSPNTGMPKIETQPEQMIFPLTDLALKSSDYIDPRYVDNSSHPDDPGIWERFRTYYGDQIHRGVNDAKNLYLSENILYMGIAVAVAAPLANTHADQAIQNWYQNGVGHGRYKALDNTANFVQQFGEYKYVIPACLALSVTGLLWPDNQIPYALGQFGNRSLRAMVIGAPMVGALQIGLGSYGPSSQNSHWQPLHGTSAVSDQAFVGAIPFLTAASMTDNRYLQALLIAGSMAPAWSVVHNDDHYFSQVLLGWAIAYLSVQSVNQTENPSEHFHIVPINVPNGVGMGVEMQF